MRLYFIANPTAGRGKTRKLLPRLQAMVEGMEDAELRLTEGPKHATELARAAAASGVDCVVSVGGDGTAIEVASALFGSEVPMAVIPSGAGCDIARAAGLPMDPMKGLALLLEGSLQPQWMDAGMLDDEPFLTVAGMGFDAEVAEQDARSRLFGLTGTVPYVLAVLQVLVRYRPSPMTVSVDGRSLSGRCLMVAIANSSCYAGGMQIAPNASMTDGLFDVVWIGDLGVIETLLVFPKVYSGGHLNHPKVKVLRGREIVLSADPPRKCHLGGELGPSTPAKVVLRHRAFRLLVPGQASDG